ncbi:MAG: MFS transporter [Planctomycetaceae bacterium]
MPLSTHPAIDDGVMATRRVFVLAALLLAMLLYVDRVCISTARDEITRDLALSDEEFGWAISSFALGYALLQTPIGALADRIGPRIVLAGVVAFWSVFTGLTGLVAGFWSLVAVRFLFGAGEAGGYPGVARAIYSWIPAPERGVVQGIVFCAGRLGAAFALPIMPRLITAVGWNTAFLILMAVGFVWSIVWFVWFRDDPAEHPWMGVAERSLILETRLPASDEHTVPRLPLFAMFRSSNLWLLMLQYFASNFTFFFCLSWLFPHLKQTYQLDSVTAGWYAAAPFVAGAVGNVGSGIFVDWLYRRGFWTASRRVPAMLGFALSAAGLLAAAAMVDPVPAVVCLSLSIFGADMTLSPSWATCVDIGRRHSGAVSGTMNMVGNLGSFATGIAFPYLLSWSGTHVTFFYVAAGLNLLAIALWCGVRPARELVVHRTDGTSARSSG